MARLSKRFAFCYCGILLSVIKCTFSFSRSELQSPRCPATTLNAASMIPNRSVHRLIAKWLQKNSENLCSVEIYEMRMKLRQLVDALKMCDEVALEDIMNTELVDFDRSSEGLSGTTLLHVVFR